MSSCDEMLSSDEEETYISDVDEEFDDYELQEHASKALHCMSLEELSLEQESRVSSVCETLCVDSQHAHVLLQTYSFNTEALFAAWFEDPEKCQEKACLPTGPTSDSGTMWTSAASRGRYLTQSCEVCANEVSPDQILGLRCGHVFCADCWRHYLGGNINEARTMGIRCMGRQLNTHTGKDEACREVVPAGFVQQLVQPATWDKYNRFLLKAFVEGCKNMHFCPSASCSKAIEVQDAAQLDGATARCDCGTSFCIRCSERAHAPASCDTLKKWQQKCLDDSETYNWIKTNTQCCPKCNRSIEKNGGCNHMTCRTPGGCGHQFCWVCRGDWNGHTSCNKYTPSDQDENEASKTRAALEKYLHYYHRFVTHQNSLKAEQALLDKGDTLAARLQDVKELTEMEVKFVRKAVLQLQECRQALQYSYAHAYYLEAKGPRDLFEFFQGSLEKITEDLSGMLEQPVETDFKVTEMINLTAVASNALKQMLNYQRAEQAGGERLYGNNY